MKARERATAFRAEAIAPEHLCEADGCLDAGEFRAPKSRDRLNDYRWFCLAHVRAYNAAWNFYAGMDADEIEAHARADVTWNRPTWPLGRQHATFRRADGEPRFNDPFGFRYGPDEAAAGAGSREGQARRKPVDPNEEALVVFEMTGPVTFAEVRKRYKELVKRHHPDANGGDKAAEERLKSINEAYATLRANLKSA